ncbi:hypothetical protein [Steroidobacter sp.]|uniref:hypothetical protein n=1 Tax=Steroidobacter sp. TaxID=1978227 RepID=UPI001A57222D|nr:hypothetical protein [Steroidobacter sp.]MBL8269683.1 hypothetical protein [Steroidobacter sp.]
MIVTPRFVFLHLHKSGGTFVNIGLVRFVADARQLGYHLPRSLIPAQFASLPLLGSVRNPWSYYVSWYSFQRTRPQPNALFLTLSAGNTLDFNGTVRNMLNLGRDDELLDRVLAALPASYINQGLNLPAAALAPIRGSGLGFYSFLYRYLYGPDVTAVKLARMEQLRVEVPQLLESVGEPMTAELRDYMNAAPAVNTSDHQPHRQLYDAELAQLVSERDAVVIERHGYTFA